MIKKLLLIIAALVGLVGVASAIGIVILSPGFIDDVEFRCQVDLQYARLSSALFKSPEGRLEMDRIQLSKDACESRKESEKKRDKFFKDLDEALEYFFTE